MREKKKQKKKRDLLKGFGFWERKRARDEK